MKNLKTFENWNDRNPAEEGMAAARLDDYLMENPKDEITLNLRAFDENGIDELINLLRNQSELIEDENNIEAIEIIEAFRNSEQ